MLLKANLFEIICISVITACFLFQMWFIFARVCRLAFRKKKLIDSNTSQFTQPVSVIICGKNESENLKQFLPLVLQQDYPEYQVVVVNDSSEDDSELILAKIKSEYPHLYYTSIPKDKKFSHGKKLAITVGVKAATHDYLIFTDADCKPISNQWLKEMASGFEPEGKEIVLGFGGYMKQKGFVNLLVRYDTFFTALQYMGFALSKKPYMGVGRNMAYKKELFMKNNGMKSHSKILSGDDDLFVKETATKNNVTIITNTNSQTISIPPETFKNWRLQKARHFTTTPYYKFSVKSELFFEPFSREFFLFAALYIIIFSNFALVSVGFLVVYFFLKSIIWRKAAKTLSQGKLYWSVWLFDFIHPWLLLWAYLTNKTGSKNNKWK